jgi:DNA-binding CsgD family transcriptional regulator/pimeloyl-ACP methyl ester carboxylesterase
MDAPPVQFVKTSDGYDIAYAVTGSGPLFLLGLTTLNHVQLAWQYPGLGPWLRELAARFQLIQMDPRGTGLSTRGLPDDVSAEDYLLDIEAVVGQLGIERFTLCGAVPGASIVVRYAIKHPEQVSALVLSAPFSGFHGLRSPALFRTMEEDWEVFVHSIVPRGLSPEDATKRIEIFKLSHTQHDMLLQTRETTAVPLTDIICDLRVPVLVLHPRDYLVVTHDEAMRIARAANGSFVLIDGADGYGNAEQSVRAIEAFIRALPPTSAFATDSSGGLSSRELEVLRLLAAGKSNQEIADALVISANTVRRHVSNVFDKTGVANRAQATAYAKDHGIA